MLTTLSVTGRVKRMKEMRLWGKEYHSNFIRKASRLRRWWTTFPKDHFTWVRILTSFYTERERIVSGCCKLLGVGQTLPIVGVIILCSLTCPYRSRENMPINLQQGNSYFLLCNFLSLWFKKCYSFKSLSWKTVLEKGLICIFRW